MDLNNDYVTSEIIKLIDKRIQVNNNNLSTCYIGTIDTVNGDGTVNCMITDIGLTVRDIPTVTIGSLSDNIQFKITQGQYCLIFCSKYTLDKYISEDDSVYSESNFDYNNAIAIVGLDKVINVDSKNVINISDNLSIIKGDLDLIRLIELLSEKQVELAGLMSDLANETASITIPLAPSGIGIPVNKAKIESIKVQIDDLKSEIEQINFNIKEFVYG